MPVSVTNAEAAQREVTPYAEEKPSGGVDWLKIAGDAISMAAGWIRDQLQKDENLAYASVALGLRQTWIGPYPISVVQSEEITFAGDVTRYPIENKDELADHIHNEPKRINLKAWLGSPLSGLGAVFAQGSGAAILDTSPFWQAKTLMIQLAKLQRDRVPVLYVSGLQIIPNMVITKFRPTLKAPSANAIEAEITLEQVKFGKAADIKGDEEDLAGETRPEDGGEQGSEDREEPPSSAIGWVIWGLGKLLGIGKPKPQQQTGGEQQQTEGE